MCCVVWIFTSCKTTSLHQVSQTNTTQQLSLGSIGKDNDLTFQKEFINTAIPTYKKPIKVSVSAIPFSKRTYKAFTKAKALQSADITINYIDSIANRPMYVQLQIADKVTMINALNNQENKAVKDYLSHNSNANVLTSISLALNQQDLENITKADAVFLIENAPKTYALQLYNNTKTHVILFNQSIVFAYKASNCCWEENDKHQRNIVDIVKEKSSCPDKTYKTAKRAKKKIHYYRFLK